jgi:hypothetical protein
MPSINFFLDQIQYNATTFQKCKLITKMYFCHLHANDNSPVNYPVTSTNRFDTNNTPFLRSNKEKKIKKCKRKEKEIGSDDLKEPNEKSHRLLMSFTRVPAQSDRREESRGSISSSQQQKLKNNEEGHKI